MLFLPNDQQYLFIKYQMNTEVKKQVYPIVSDYPTTKLNNKGYNVEAKTILAMKRFSDAGQAYSIVGYPVEIQAVKNTFRYMIKICDGTQTIEVLDISHQQTNWLHSIKEYQYYQFILHCRFNQIKELNEFYIQKINQVSDFNQITFHIAKCILFLAQHS